MRILYRGERRSVCEHEACRVSPTAKNSSVKMERILFQNDVGDKTAPTTIVHEDNYTLVESQEQCTHSKVFCCLFI